MIVKTAFNNIYLLDRNQVVIQHLYLKNPDSRNYWDIGTTLITMKHQQVLTQEEFENFILAQL